MITEVWKDIVDFEGYYQISNLGNVKSLDRIVKHSKDNTRIQYGKYKKHLINKDGYLYVLLYKNNKIKQHLIHRLIANAFIDNPENKETINHINGIKTDNSIENLEWNTYSENVKHAWRIGLSKSKFGDKANNKKLTEKQVLEILELNKTNTHKELAKKFNVSRSCISMVCCGKNWTKVISL